MPCLYESYIEAREKAEASNSGLGVCLVYMGPIQKLKRKQRPPILEWECALSESITEARERKERLPMLGWGCGGLQFWIGSVPCLYESYIEAGEKAEASNSGVGARLIYRRRI